MKREIFNLFKSKNYWINFLLVIVSAILTATFFIYGFGRDFLNDLKHHSGKEIFLLIIYSSFYLIYLVPYSIASYYLFHKDQNTKLYKFLATAFIIDMFVVLIIVSAGYILDPKPYYGFIGTLMMVAGISLPVVSIMTLSHFIMLSFWKSFLKRAINLNSDT